MSIEQTVLEIAKRARKASLELANLDAAKKNAALLKIAVNLRQSASLILRENRKDVHEASVAGLSKPMIERLSLDEAKIEKMALGVEEVAALPDYVGEIIESIVRPNGIKIDKVRVPIGVIGIIYESRPNVTVDCAALCLKSGNAAILRGGKECFNTNLVLAALISNALDACGIPESAVQILPTSDRAALTAMLKLDTYINCIIPRGGEGLIRFVAENSTIPVIKHYKGVCNVYIDKFADLKTALNIAVDAKCQRPSVCNAAENLIAHKDAVPVFLKVAEALSARGVEIRATKDVKELLLENGIRALDASPEDFDTEYGDLIIAADIVESLPAAIDFVNAHSSAHSDCIVTQDAQRAEEFLNGVDSATVYWNASTRFTDGFEFGFGAEIGISTDKLHARGPMGLKELNSYKYKIRGEGQTRGKPALL